MEAWPHETVGAAATSARTEKATWMMKTNHQCASSLKELHIPLIPAIKLEDRQYPNSLGVAQEQ